MLPWFVASTGEHLRVPFPASLPSNFRFDFSSREPWVQELKHRQTRFAFPGLPSFGRVDAFQGVELDSELTRVAGPLPCYTL